MKNMIGSKVGQLVIVEQVDDRTADGHIRWRCVCVCGNEVIRVGKTLRRDGRTMSCGCQLKKRRRMVTADTKQCKACGEVKHVDQFQMLRHYDRPGKPHYWTSRCKACAAEYNRIRLYGTTLAEMIAKQGSALCQPCNRVLHYFENKEWRARAENYLAVQERSPTAADVGQTPGDRQEVGR